MGSYTFTWAHPADEVYVTGDFDNWGKTIKLEKEDGVFKKTVDLPEGKHHYKFVVDGNWLTNDSHPKEDDGKGIYNNVLHPHDLQPTTLSSAAPDSTTAALAAAVPKEETAATEPAEEKPTKEKPSEEKPSEEKTVEEKTAEEAPKEKSSEPMPTPSHFPGSFPETPANEPGTFSVNPIPATEGLGNPVKLAPGEKVPEPSTLTSNTVSSTVETEPKAEEPEETVSVAPIPATAGPGNPIHLEPGEKVPDASTLTSNTIDSTVRTDAASYEKSDALPPQLGPVVMTPEAEREAKGGMFALPPLTGPVIPESSLPMETVTKDEQDTGVTIQSAAPTSTTAALAGQVPLEPRVPAAVTESQQEAHAPAEASANPEAVEDKRDVEEELKQKVPEQPATTESNAAADNVPAAVAESQEKAHAPSEATANAEAVSEKKTVEEELKEKVPEQPATLESGAAAENVPATVVESQEKAHVPNEAAANPEAVEDKKEMEEELKQKVPEQPATVADVPATVKLSQREAHESPEASANPEAVNEKQAVEAELLKKVPEQPAAADNTYATQAKNAISTGATALAGAAATGAAVAAATLTSAKNKAVETAEVAKDTVVGSTASAKDSAVETATATKEKAVEATTSPEQTEAAPAVPDVVVESQKEAHVSPEAAANQEAVEEKKQFEKELLAEVPPTDEAGEPAPAITAALTETAPAPSPEKESSVPEKAAAATAATAGAFAAATYAAKDKAAEAVGLNGNAEATSTVPEVVAESQKEAHASPEAAANKEAVEEKKAVEKELLKEVWTTNEPGTPAPKITADLAEAAPNAGEPVSVPESKTTPSAGDSGLNASAATPAQPLDFKPVSDKVDDAPAAPNTTTQTEPVVTTGVESGKTEAKSEPAAAAASSEPTKAETTTAELATASQTQPTVTTGVETGATEAKSTPAAADTTADETKAAPETPKKENGAAADQTPERSASTAGASATKKKRQSWFGKLKAKFKGA